MGVNTKSFDNASDMITFSRASGAYGLTKVGYGSELVTNGDFSDGSTGWTASSATLSVVSGRLQVVATSAYGGFNQIIPVNPNTFVEYSFDIAAGSGQIVAQVYDESYGTLLHNYSITAGTSQTTTVSFSTQSFSSIRILIRSVTASTFTVGSLSMREVTYNSSDPSATLKLIYHPNDVPRIEYNTDGTAKGLLIEEARTNLIVNSEDFTAASWAGKTQHTGQANAAISPAGTQTATRITSTGVDPYIFQFTPVTAGNDYVLTVWLRGIGNTVGRAPKVWFISSSGTISSTFDSTPLTNSWQKYTVTGSCTASGTVLTRIDFDDSGLSANGEQIDVWGAQVEAGSFPTSYIKTTGATATRAADVASIGVGEFGYSKAAGTILIEHNRLSASLSADLFMAATNSSFNPSSFGIHGSSTLFGYVRANSAYVGTVSFGATNNETTKSAFSFGDSNVLGCSNGGVVSASSLSGYPTTVTEFEFMNIGVTGTKHSGHIKSIQYYPRRLTGAQIQELTT